MGMNDLVFAPTTEMERHLTWWAAVQLEVLQSMAHAAPPGPSPGVYWLIDYDLTVLYVGQSKNVSRRLNDHRLVRHFRCMMIGVPDTEARLKLEGRMIQLFSPPLNRGAGKRPQYDPELGLMFARVNEALRRDDQQWQ